MGKPLRYATVLFLLGLLAMASMLGGESAGPLGFGGPADEEWLMQARSEYYTNTELTVDDPTAPWTGGGRTAETSGQGASAIEQAAGHAPSAPMAAGVVPPGASPSGADDLVAGSSLARDTGTANPGSAGGAATALTAADAASAGRQEQQPARDVPVLQERPLIVKHVVQRGETLWDIARRYGIDVDTIVAANDLVDINRLQVGQELTILTVKGALHTVQRGESLWDIARTYGVSMDEIASVNRLADPGRLQVGQQLIVPGAQAQALAARRETLVSSSGQLLRNFDYPVQGGRISSRFGQRWGRMHYGLDIAVPTGTPVRAAAAGTVTYAGSIGGYGNLVIIDHGNRVETRYAHNSRIVVKVGQKVKRGELIAYSGNTGNSTGPHLHFEIRYRGTAVNPENYLKR